MPPHTTRGQTSPSSSPSPNPPEPNKSSLPKAHTEQHDLTGWRDLIRTPGRPQRPLRLLIVGHNPSDASFTAKHYYAHPNNRFYRLLIAADIIAPGTTAVDDRTLPYKYGIGFTDLWQVKGSHSRKVQSEHRKGDWRNKFYGRLKEIENELEGQPPRIVAFTGKGIFQALCGKKVKIEHGRQTIQPEGWPWPDEAENRGVIRFVLASPSGRAPMKNEDRLQPYIELSALLKQYNWPLGQSKRSLDEAECVEDQKQKRQKNQHLDRLESFRYQK